MKKIVLSLLMALGTFGVSHAHKLTIKVTNIDNRNGRVALVVFSKEHFMDYQHAAWAKAIEASADTLTFEANLPEGSYAVMVMHDENMNNTVDLGQYGIPTEATGMSNNPVLSGFPTFEQIGFKVAEDKEIEIKMVRYKVTK